MLKCALLLAATSLVGSCGGGGVQVANVPVQVGNAALTVVAVSELEGKAQEVSVCDLKIDPAKYNHAIVKVSGYHSRGFEDSTLYDPVCKERQVIWVDMGGRRSINVMYCCDFTPSPERTEDLQVEDIRLPIVEDAAFDKYDELLASRHRAKATVVGTFFSGEKTQTRENGPTWYGGYGHMGIGSLFIVQQVLAVEPTSVEDK